MGNKHLGQYYTPQYLVWSTLDIVNYIDEVLRKHIIDNSCGDGSFLYEIVLRYLTAAYMSKEEVKEHLETYIHGIEMDEQEHKKCIDRLNELVNGYDIYDVKWDIVCGDALKIHDYDGKMDFVVGNPPYVNIHNINDRELIKNYEFSKEGMTDLFITFYEVGLRMLNDSGVLVYITPSSILNSRAGRCARRHFIEHSLLDTVVNLEHFQPFDATTYTAILVLDKGRAKYDSMIDYYTYSPTRRDVINKQTIAYEDFYINGNYYFGNGEELARFNDIMINGKKSQIAVKNGFQTSADSIYIGDFNFDDGTIPVVKATTGQVRKAIFPYKDDTVIKFDDLPAKITEYLTKHQDKIKKRNMVDGSEWYEYGRFQGIKDVKLDKITVNNIIRNIDDIRFTDAPSGTGVYGGIYMTIPDKETGEYIKDKIKSEEFFSYVRILGKYKNGGYYIFSAADLQKYVDFVVG